MFRSPLLRAALLAGLVLACDRRPDVGEPPLPGNLADFDPRAAARIQEARAKVLVDRSADRAWAELGMVYASERLKGLAIECYRAAGRLAPQQPKWPYREAVTLGQTGALAEAITAMERALALEPGYPPSHARLGGFRLELGDLDGAERAFARAAELDSSYPGGFVGLAKVALQRDRPLEAVEIAERLCRRDPEDRTFRQLLAVARRQAGAADELTSEVVLADDEVPVWNDPWELEARSFREKPGMLRVARLLENGRMTEALEVLEAERASGAEPADTALHFATAYQQLGRGAEALLELERLLALEPENTSALVLLAQFLDDAGRVTEAIEALERVTTLQPGYGGAFAAKGSMLFEHGYHEAAVEALRRAIELGVGDYELRFVLGQSLIVLKRWPEAHALFTALVAERSDHGDAWLELAIARLRTGDLPAAEEALARARATGNASPRLLGDVERSLGNARERRTRREEQIEGGG
jgi:tetratricopeptide (TPR) repeat protein